MYDDLIDEYFQKLGDTIKKVDVGGIKKLIKAIIKCQERERMIYTCGNGGSAGTASHYIVDWGKMYELHTNKPFRAISLTDNNQVLTAYSNDVSFEDIFSGQIRAIGKKNDLLICISGSGNSKNVLKALKTANELGLVTASVTGYDGGYAKKLSDISVHIPIDDMQIAEDLHLSVGHIVMKAILQF